MIMVCFETFMERVIERGEYRSSDEADRAVLVVLALLGAHLIGHARARLAALLPETFALVLLNPLPAAQPLNAERFVRATAAWIEGATEATALWDIGAVLSVVADIAGPGLMAQVLIQVPADWPPLFGMPEHADAA